MIQLLPGDIKFSGSEVFLGGRVSLLGFSNHSRYWICFLRLWSGYLGLTGTCCTAAWVVGGGTAGSTLGAMAWGAGWAAFFVSLLSHAASAASPAARITKLRGFK